MVIENYVCVCLVNISQQFLEVVITFTGPLAMMQVLVVLYLYEHLIFFCHFHFT
jgi:hypothetical protein